MKLFRLLLMAVMVASVAQAKVRVVTTLTDLADFTREVGGDLVEVRSLATGVEDTHGVPMKPSFVPVMNRADLIVLVGFGCEHAFLPALLEASKNPRIQPGHPGYVDCSKGITPVDVPKSTDHSAGDVHPAGNPHYTLDPVLAKVAVAEICDALVAFAPQHEAEFKRNRDAYLAKLDAKIAEWETAAAPIKGAQFVSYHEHWPYFAERFGLVYFGTIELKPGIDPTARHIEELVSSMKADHVPIVVREPQFPEKVPALIAQETGATLVKLPIMPGGVPGTDTYIAMMDYIVKTMVAARKEMNDAVITLEGLAIGYDGRAVLSGISLSIAHASFTAILGANGSGKSTLLKTLLGLQPPVAGRIRIDAPVIFGYVPQTIQFDPLYPLTGFDVALMGVYGRVGPGRRVPAGERAFVRECLHATGAAEFAGQRFAELSGGQKQRVLIARALATKANVLVLDEPTAGVDAAATHALLEFISQIHEERKLMVLLVTHDLPLVRKHAQQIIWLHQGQILHGTVAELLTPERLAEVFELELS